MRKIGSVPADGVEARLIPAGVTVQPSDGWWHVLQARPLLPSVWKNGLVRSIAPAVLIVDAVPIAFSEKMLAGCAGSGAGAPDCAKAVVAVGQQQRCGKRRLVEHR